MKKNFAGRSSSRLQRREAGKPTGGRCEAPGCTGRGKQRGLEREDRSDGAPLELQDRLCLCEFHYTAVADGFAGCWGTPPLDVLWRLGRGDDAEWFRNETRLDPAEVERWSRDNRRESE